MELSVFICSQCKETSRSHQAKGLCGKCYQSLRPRKTCIVDNCQNKALSKEFCKKHRYTIGVETAKIQTKGVFTKCSIDDCEYKSRAIGLCNKHYGQAKRRENPNFDLSRSSVERTKENFQYKSESYKKHTIKKASEKKLKREQKLSGPSIIKTNGILKYTLDAHLLAKTAGFQISNLKKILDNLKDEGSIINFNYDKSLMIVEIFIDEYSELNFVYQESLGLTDQNNDYP